MNYIKVYQQLIAKRQKFPLLKQKNTGVELHHIIPKSMGGTNNIDNLIVLTIKEHFIAHHLLWKIYRNPQMAFAFQFMSNKGKCNARTYEKLHAELSTYQSNKMKGNKYWLGKKHTTEYKEKMRKRFKGIPLNRTVVEKIRQTNLKNQKLNKHVLQFDANGNFIAEFNGARLAERQFYNKTGIKINIRNSIRRGTKAGGFIWKYKDIKVV